MRHLRQLGDSVTIPMPTDETGFTGRECPNPGCLGYFKIRFGTGLKGEKLPCHCPYCGHEAGQDQFWTQDQLEYAKSVVLREVTNAIRLDVTEWDRQLRRQTRNSFIKLSVSFKGSNHPIRYYREKELETQVLCEKCTLEYAIYGVFAYCPDCGTHNSLQILRKNLDLARKELTLASKSDDAELAAYLLGDALENAVSAFDGFGRETCRVNSSKASDTQQAQHLSFQNLSRVQRRISSLFGFDFAGAVDDDTWDFACRCFQKRHLLAHKMGVVDQQYLDSTGDSEAVVGRNVPVNADEIENLLHALEQLGEGLTAQFGGTPEG